MSKSRYGSFRTGKNRIIGDFVTLKSPSTIQADPPSSATNFDYTASQGIWSLNSTVQFPKRENFVVEIGTSTLSYELFGIKNSNNAWVQRTVNLSKFANKTGRVVFRYINDDGGELGDLQLDLIVISGTSYSFENVTHSFQTSTTSVKSYSSVIWANLAVATTNGRWNVRTGATPTTNTSRSDAAGGTYFVYAETSGIGSARDYNFWLRSPSLSFGSSPSLTFYEARNGSTIGELYVYVELIS